jgi:hypothetical protein
MAIEDHPAVFVAVAVVRSLLRRRTVGFMFRPGQCFTPRSPRHTLKRTVFRVVSKLPATHVLTLLPHDVDPRFDRISSGWIFDPQLWDLGTHDSCRPQSTPLQDEIRASAGGRRILLALGDQNRLKGFDLLTRVLQSATFPVERIAAVVAGPVAPECRDMMNAFVSAGGLLYDRRLTDDEFLGLYFDANLIWNCYAPDYDQASGIFGRAFQVGVPSVVRAGSYLVKLAEHLGHPIVQIDPTDATSAAEVIANCAAEKCTNGTAARIEKLRQISLGALLAALAVSPTVDIRA